MLLAARLLPAAAKFLRQIVPPVIATLIAAVLIAAYNQTFSGHLTQPRMSALHAEAAPARSPAAAKTAEPAADVITIHEYVDEPERLADKEAGFEAGKDQSAIKIAAEPAAPRAAPAPERTAAPAPRPEPRRMAAIEHAQPMPPPVIHVQPAPVIAVQPLPAPVVVGAPVIVAAPAAPPVAQQPPPVIVGAPPMVTVPDRPGTRPMEEPQPQAGTPPRGAIGVIVDTLKPSNWFARAREFGEKIEQAGNDILPNIRP